MILTSFQPSFIPIIKELKNYEIVTMHPNFTKMLSDIDVTAKSLSDFMTEENFELSKLTAAKKLVDYDTNYQLFGSVGEFGTKWLQEKSLMYFFSRIDDLSAITLTLDRINPGIIILHNDVEPMMRILALWAKSRGKPCLHIPHAIYLENGGRGAVGTDIHDMITASYVVTSGPYQTDWFMKRGMNPDNIFLTGLPQFDRLAERKFDRNKACAALGLEIRKPVVTYMSSWRQDTNLLGCHDGVEESYLAFLNAAKEMPDIQWIVSCHPRGNNTKQHIDLAKENGVRCLVIGGNYLDQCITASNVVIIYGASNVVLETAVFGNANIISVGDEQAFPYDNEIIKSSLDNITNSVQTALSNLIQDYSAFRRKYFYRVDGNNYLRIAELIRKLHVDNSHN